MRELSSEYGIKGKVLDVGSYSVNGCYKELFEDYTGSDVVPGPNVDIVQTDQYRIPVDDGFFDSVISGQALEHCENPFKIMVEMCRVLKVGGPMAIVVPWKMDYHGERHYMDCWRFSPDAFKCLSKDLPLTILKNEFVMVYNPYEIGTVFVAIKI